MRILTVLLLCFLSLHSRAQPAQLLHRSYAAKYDYLDSLWGRITNKDADAAQSSAQLDSLEKWAKTKGDEDLSMSFALLKLRLDMAKGYDLVQLEERISKIALDAHEKKFEMLEADALRVLGEYWAYKKKLGQAFEYELAAYKIYSKYTPEEYPQKQYYLYLLGMHYVQYGDNDNAFRVLMQAKAAKGRDIRYLNLINNALGLYYRGINKYDSAIFLFRQIYDDAVANHNKQWVGIAAGNIGICYFYEKRYEDAIPLLEKDIDTSLATKQVRNALHSMSILAEIYFNKNDMDRSEQILTKALSIGRSKDWWP